MDPLTQAYRQAILDTCDCLDRLAKIAAANGHSDCAEAMTEVAKSTRKTCDLFDTLIAQPEAAAVAT